MGRQLVALCGLGACLAALYLAGLLNLTTTARAAGGLLGLYAVVVVTRLLPFAEGDHDLETFSGWREPVRGGRLARVRRRAKPRPAPTDPLERMLLVSSASAADFDTLLRPRLAAVARRRLVDAGLDPADLEQVAERLGPLGARVLDPRIPPRRDLSTPGEPLTDVAALLVRLEEMS